MALPLDVRGSIQTSLAIVSPRVPSGTWPTRSDRQSDRFSDGPAAIRLAAARPTAPREAGAIHTPSSSSTQSIGSPALGRVGPQRMERGARVRPSNERRPHGRIKSEKDRSMKLPGIPVRVAVAGAISLAVIAVGAGIGGASTSSPSPRPARTISAASSGVAVSTPAPSVAPIEPSFPWCCSGPSGPGLTVTGQASVNGRGTSGRDQAIAKAVADATDQATAAAEAAGVTLGRTLNMEVFASEAYPCPVAGEFGATGIAGPTIDGSTPSSGAVVSCQPSVACPAQPCTGSYATASMTWSIE